MLQDYNRYKVLREFFKYPTKGLRIREIARNTKLGQPSVINHLNALKKKGLIVKEDGDIYPIYKANRENEEFKILKRFDVIWVLHNCGGVEKIYSTSLPSSIVLFGSASRGEDVESSDIDIFVQAKPVEIELKECEQLLNRKISLFFEENFHSLPDELKNNIANGILLKGYLRVL